MDQQDVTRQDFSDASSQPNGNAVMSSHVDALIDPPPSIDEPSLSLPPSYDAVQGPTCDIHSLREMIIVHAHFIWAPNTPTRDFYGKQTYKLDVVMVKGGDSKYTAVVFDPTSKLRVARGNPDHNPTQAMRNLFDYTCMRMYRMLGD